MTADPAPRDAAPAVSPAPAQAVPAGLGPHVPGLLPRLVLVLAAATGALAAAAGGAPLPGALLVVGLALLTAWRPALPTAGAAVLGLGVLAVVAGTGAGAVTAVLVLSVHTLHTAAGLAAAVEAGGRLELAALRPTRERFLLVQALSQATVVVAALTPAVSLAW